MSTPPALPVPAPVPEVRFVFAAPSPYTARFDATRAGLGIALELQRLAREQQLPVRISLMALPSQAGRAEVRALLGRAAGAGGGRLYLEPGLGRPPAPPV